MITLLLTIYLLLNLFLAWHFGIIAFLWRKLLSCEFSAFSASREHE